MDMPASFRGWVILSCVCLSVAGIAQDRPLIELIEFLGEWSDEDGNEIDFEMFDDSTIADREPKSIIEEKVSPGEHE